MGLLQKTLMLYEKKALTLFDFTKKYNITYSAILEKSQNSYMINYSTGIDILSIITSISSSDFWEGIIKQEDKIYNFTNENECRPFLQIFSDEIQTKIEKLVVIRTNKNIVLFANTDFTINNENNFISEIKSISENQNIINKVSFIKENDENIQLFKISFEKCIQEFLNKHYLKNEYLQEIKKSIYNRICNQFKKNLKSNDYVAINNNYINFSMVTKSILPATLIQKHLESSLQNLIYDNNANINLEDFGVANSVEELINFLKG